MLSLPGGNRLGVSHHPPYHRGKGKARRTWTICWPSPATWRARRSACSQTPRPGRSSPTSRSSGRSSRNTSGPGTMRSRTQSTRGCWHAHPDDRRPADRGVPRVQHGHPGCGEARDFHPALLLSPWAFHRRKLPDLPGGGGEEPEAPDRLQHAGDRRDGGAHQERQGRGWPARRVGIPPGQPPARLPGLRPVGRMRPPELLHELRALRSPVSRAEGQEEEGRAPSAPT